MSTDKLMKKLIDGEQSAFEELYKQTRKTVYYVALSILREKYLAEDVMQSTYLSVLKNAAQYKIGTNATAWIIKIAKNQALNLKKSRKRETCVDESESAYLFDTCRTDDYGLLIDLARRTLSDDEFTILMLVSSCGYKRREIGEMLDMPVPTVTWKYNNAIEKMKSALAPKAVKK